MRDERGKLCGRTRVGQNVSVGSSGVTESIVTSVASRSCEGELHMKNQKAIWVRKVEGDG